MALTDQLRTVEAKADGGQFLDENDTQAVSDGRRSHSFDTRLSAAKISSRCWGAGKSGEGKPARAIVETMHAAPVGPDADPAVYALCVRSHALALAYLSVYSNSDDDPGDGPRTRPYPCSEIVTAFREALGVTA